jgi:hypothetical protein
VRRGRARERGATLFVVVLVITLLMGIGTYAARSAHLATQASGYERQQTQARYIAEYALLLVSSKLSTPSGYKILVDTANPAPTSTCYAQAAAAMISPTCSLITYQDRSAVLLGLQADLTTVGFNVCDPATIAAAGSLGPAATECDFKVELTDVVKGATRPGDQGSNLFYWYVTATVTGQVRLRAAALPVLDPTAGQSSSTQTLRSHLAVGPFPVPFKN